MAEPLAPGSGLIYMKVGTHAGEPLEAIIERKRREIDEAGYALWGYGGNTCHPLTMVQPFARDFERRNGVIYLCMQPMESRHFAVSQRADVLSQDGVLWEPIPAAINVIGSRYALAITDLTEEEFDLELTRTKVAIGNSVGQWGDHYIKGRVDKACLEVTNVADESEAPRSVQIRLTARLTDPYAVLVR
jgi:hypothetical protein